MTRTATASVRGRHYCCDRGSKCACGSVCDGEDIECCGGTSIDCRNNSSDCDCVGISAKAAEKTEAKVVVAA